MFLDRPNSPEQVWEVAARLGYQVIDHDNLYDLIPLPDRPGHDAPHRVHLARV